MSARECPFSARGAGCAALLLLGQLGCSPRYELLRSLDEDGAGGSLAVSGGTGSTGDDVGGSVGTGGNELGVGGTGSVGTGGNELGFGGTGSVGSGGTSGSGGLAGGGGTSGIAGSGG
ncbi:MAG TPA: hypothetical protein VHP33_22710 [Polyangiaceae bacterium]|nr:hypothetical protein [Polyangiaceae bacterium]